MSHPAWPSTVWQTYSSDYETNGVYFGSRKACEPLHIQFRPDSHDVYFINNTLIDYPDIRTELKIFDTGSKEIYRKSYVNFAKANSSVKCFTAEFPENLPQIYFVTLRTYSKKEILLSENSYFQTVDGKKDYRVLNSLKSETLAGRLISKKISGKMETIVFSITNQGKVMAVSVKLNVRNNLTGKRVLPAYISDGYFTLLPGETRKIIAEYQAADTSDLLKITAEGLNVPLQNIVRIR
jgi:hypothetical protein